MRPYFSATLLASLLGLSACNGPTHPATSATAAPATPPPAAARPAPVAREVAAATLAPARVRALTSDYATWYRYAYYHVPLARAFRPLDASGQPIAKRQFLRQLVAGRVVALLNGTERETPVYQLYAYAGNQEIRTTSQQLAREALQYVDREGKQVPAFHFTDLQGRTYTPASTRGKVLVLKTWFIRCGACVKEFPEVNALADRYRTNKDVLFVSLALDDAASLRAFLKGRPLHYAVVPDAQAYITHGLQLQGYPTHLVVGRDGRIAHVTNSPAYLPAAIDAALQPARPLAAR